MNNKARHNLIDAKYRWRSDQLDGAGSNREPLGQTKVMQIHLHQRETLNHQGAITHEVCCLAAQFPLNSFRPKIKIFETTSDRSRPAGKSSLLMKSAKLTSLSDLVENF